MPFRADVRIRFSPVDEGENLIDAFALLALDEDLWTDENDDESAHDD